MLDIIYEDNHIIVVNKEKNVLVQANNTNDIDLLTKIKSYLKEKYNKPGNVYLGLVHRLDRPVSGVMVFAKTSKAASRLSKEIRGGKFKKTYYAVVIGKVDNMGTFEDRLLKNTKRNITTVDIRGKKSILDYELIAYKDGMSLVKINLITGRSHQIRVQFALRGLPLYGDNKYGKEFKKTNDIALISKRIEFKHPVKEEVVHYEVPIPDRYPFNIFK
jgi:23S rRNA pseudouridine1911/1915/1917 synthase